VSTELFLASLPNKNTQDAYRRNLRRFEDFLGADRLSALEPRDLLDFITQLREDDFAPASINQQLASIKSYLRWAAVYGAVAPSVYSAAQVVAQVKQPKGLPKPFREGEVAALRAQADLSTFGGSRDYAFMQLALSTGCRLSELVGLNVEDVDWDRQEFVVTGKGSKDRVALFHAEAAAAVVAFLNLRGAPATGPVFVNDEGNRISARYIQAQLRRLGEAAGVSEVHAHRFRHTFAVAFLNKTRGNVEALSTLLGHADPRTTRIYASLATDVLREVYDTAFARPETLDTVRERVSVR